jgi:aspartate aminotransferase
MYTREELTAIAEVLRKNPQIFVISDDIYNRLVFDGSSVAPHLLHVAPDLKGRVLCVNGGSKTYSMTGWRIGWAAGPAPLIKAMADYQSQATGSPSSIAQEALRVALNHSEYEIRDIVQKLSKRRDLALRLFGEIPGFRVIPPAGAFYVWVDVSGLNGRTYQGQKISSDKDVCGLLLDKEFVATVPGAECGSPGYMRLSIAASEEQISRAAERMKKFVLSLG